jgi:hypothetical protein
VSENSVDRSPLEKHEYDNRGGDAAITQVTASCGSNA